MDRGPQKFLALFLVASALGTPAIGQFKAAIVEGTNGRVGYHMDIRYPAIYKWDLPAGNTGGAWSGTCQATWDSPTMAYVGDLPPGVQWVGNNGSNVGIGARLFTGTPRQPGVWHGIVRAQVACMGGPDRNIYERTIPVTFKIDP